MVFDEKSWAVHRHLAQQSDARLELVRRVPERVMLVGADADISRRLLAARYPDAVFAEYDARQDFLDAASEARQEGFWRRLTGKSVPQHCAAWDAPLPDAWADMLWSNLALADAPQIVPVLKNWAAALKTDGLLFFTHFGRDTLADLRCRLNAEGLACAADRLPDMHDLGDMLADNGFYDPVTDTAKLTLTYKKPQTFWQDMAVLGVWRALGWDNPQAAEDCVNGMFARDGGLDIVLETVYGHALKRLVLPQGESVVRFFPKP